MLQLFSHEHAGLREAWQKSYSDRVSLDSIHFEAHGFVESEGRLVLQFSAVNTFHFNLLPFYLYLSSYLRLRLIKIHKRLMGSIWVKL